MNRNAAPSGQVPVSHQRAGAPGRALPRSTGVAGLATVVLLFGGQLLIQVGGGEPAFDASAAAIADYFGARDQTLFAIGTYLNVVAVVLFLWFVGGVYTLLRDDWRATIALISGVLGVAPVLTAGWELAVYRVPEGVDSQIARLAFDLGNLSFASGWVALGSFAVASGWAGLATRALPRWLSWWIVAAGVCLVAARAVWATPIWLVGYAFFWLWVVALSVRLLRWRRPQP
ncbi:hypothetical protein [Micromonospora sp. SL4-19]|uniref:hypothetical protein n=1 Tax=Micromonospora sp. SL4-19 TaxID=3399129 RepID=UPI003A4DEA36